MVNNKSLAKIGIVLLAMNYCMFMLIFYCYLAIFLLFYFNILLTKLANKVEIEKDGFVVPELDDW